VQLQQVILINAVEAMSSMREGARELLICIEKAESNDALAAVRDSGPGLDLKSVDRLFETFSTTKLQGMGIGLAICRSIIEAHGGQMWGRRERPQRRHLSIHIARPHGPSILIGAETVTRRLMPA
jgi:C4-dicarboxylate-specific signal transduction histidine kinase